MLRTLQNEVEKWADHNFGDKRDPFFGVVEEVGELSHAILKKKQEIRGTAKEHEDAITDAVADIVIFLSDFCALHDIDFESCVLETWDKVKKRDWKKYPKTGFPDPAVEEGGE